MSDYIIVEGDQAVFMPAFGAAIVVVQPGVMQASGQTTLAGKKICLQGDESKLSVPGCGYMTPQYSIPGVGTLKINALGGNQTSKKAKSGNKAIILKGSLFTAKFEVQTPAQQPTPAGPVPDATPMYSGSGNFITTNLKFTAS
ncbi:MAG: hypothetical protein INR73_06610 [Williamsia sp.]|nr:hypothetical protein [Williamsia sp.]